MRTVDAQNQRRIRETAIMRARIYKQVYLWTKIKLQLKSTGTTFSGVQNKDSNVRKLHYWLEVASFHVFSRNIHGYPASCCLVSSHTLLPQSFDSCTPPHPSFFADFFRILILILEFLWLLSERNSSLPPGTFSILINLSHAISGFKNAQLWLSSNM